MRDHQPDILFRGDPVRRVRHRRLAEADFLTRTIAFELAALDRTRDPARRGAGRSWILEAQRRRRAALTDPRTRLPSRRSLP